MCENIGELSHSELKNLLDDAKNRKVKLEKSLENECAKNLELIISAELAESNLKSYEEELSRVINRRDTAKTELEMINKNLNESFSKMNSYTNNISSCESYIIEVLNKIKTYELNLVSSLTIAVIENNKDLINILLNHIKDEVRCNE